MDKQTSDTTIDQIDIATTLTEKEAAAMLCKSRVTLRSWRVKGKGPRYIKMGLGKNSIRYEKAEVEKYRALHSKVLYSTAEGKVR